MIYTIKQGRHYSTHWVGMVWRFLTGWKNFPQLRARVTFDDNCLVPSKDADDINKLFGLSSGFDHHRNSARFGWRANGDKVQILAYVYKGGKREHDVLCEVSPFDEVHMEMVKTAEGWDLRAYPWGPVVNRKTYKAFAGNAKYYKRLYPYFGGTYPAPVDMKIKIDWL